MDTQRAAAAATAWCLHYTGARTLTPPKPPPTTSGCTEHGTGAEAGDRPPTQKQRSSFRPRLWTSDSSVKDGVALGRGADGVGGDGGLAGARQVEVHL